MTGDDHTLRPAGASRIFGAAFLGVWLCGWAVGEAIVLRILGVPLERLLPQLARLPARRGVDGPPRAFLLFWAIFWTVGGVAALFAFLRLLGGRDVVSLGGDGLTVRREAFGVGSTRRIARGEIEAVELRRKDGALVVRSGTRQVPLSALGTREERRALRDAIRARYGARASDEVPPRDAAPILPSKWEASLAPGGEWVVRLSQRTRRQMSGCLSVFALVFFAVVAWHLRGGAVHGAALLRVVVFSLLALGALTLAAGREELAVWPGRLDQRRRFGPFSRTRSFVGARLRVTFSGTGDDEWGLLEVVTPEGASRLWSSADDRLTPILLGRWLAARTGWALDEPGE